MVGEKWIRVRELVAYLRYGRATELAKLNQIWELDGVFTNYLLPEQKLVFKQRNERRETDGEIGHRDHPAPAGGRQGRHAQTAEHPDGCGVPTDQARSRVPENPRADRRA